MGYVWPFPSSGNRDAARYDNAAATGLDNGSDTVFASYP